MRREYRGKCPFTNDNQTIHVRYKEIVMTQKRSQNYKKYGFDCIHTNEFPNAENCPIYNDAPKSVTE